MDQLVKKRIEFLKCEIEYYTSKITESVQKQDDKCKFLYDGLKAATEWEIVFLTDLQQKYLN